MYVGQFCVCCSGDSDISRWGKVSQPPPEMGQASRVGGARASPAAGSSAGPPRHPPGRGPWCLRGEGPCTGPPHRACPPAGGAAWALSPDRRGSRLLGRTLSAQPPAAPPTGRARSLPLRLCTFGASTGGPSPPLTSAHSHGEAHLPQTPHPLTSSWLRVLRPRLGSTGSAGAGERLRSRTCGGTRGVSVSMTP